MAPGQGRPRAKPRSAVEFALGRVPCEHTLWLGLWEPCDSGTVSPHILRMPPTVSPPKKRPGTQAVLRSDFRGSRMCASPCEHCDGRQALGCVALTAPSRAWRCVAVSLGQCACEVTPTDLSVPVLRSELSHTFFPERYLTFPSAAPKQSPCLRPSRALHCWGSSDPPHHPEAL